MRRGILPHKQDWLHVLISLLLTPLFYCYEVLYILPGIYEEWTLPYNIHLFNSIFLMHNIVGNLVNGARGGGTVTRELFNKSPPPNQEWKLCDECNFMAPPRSWHCSVCDICIMKRDHHCNFFGCCVGYRNHRYFCMFVFYVFVSTLYGLFFNVMYLIYFVDWNVKSWLAFTKFLFPLAAVAVDTSMESFNVLLLVINIIVTGFTGFLFVYHGRFIMRGQTTPESKHRQFVSYNNGRMNNLKDVLGERWYFAILSPFLESKLPSDGTYWNFHGLVKQE